MGVLRTGEGYKGMDMLLGSSRVRFGHRGSKPCTVALRASVVATAEVLTSPELRGRAREKVGKGAKRRAAHPDSNGEDGGVRGLSTVMNLELLCSAAGGGSLGLASSPLLLGFN